MDVLEIVDMLEDVVEKSMTIPFFGRAFVDKDELMDLIQEIRMNLPDDLKQAKWIKEERQRILLEAQKESNTIIKGAQEQLISMIDEHEITKNAREQASDIVAASQATALEIRTRTMQYADEKMLELESQLAGLGAKLGEVMSEVRENRKEFK